MGQVVASYGVLGWLAVRGEIEALSGIRRWWIDGIERTIERRRMHSGRLLAKLAGVETREQARLLRGKPVSVPRDALAEPAQGTYYWADLAGLEVVTDQGLVLGVVKEMFSNGAHDVMQLAGEGRERLLPFVPAVVKRVDLVARRIEVDWGADW